MAITLLSGGARSGRTEAVLDGARGHIARGEEPILLVPTREYSERCLRELAGDRAAMGVRVERFEALIGECALRAGMSEAPLPAAARERLIATIAARAAAARAPGAGPSADMPAPGFARELGWFIAELQVRRVTPSRFSRALSAWAAEDGAAASRAELGELFEEYARALLRLGRLDAEQRAVRALDALRREPALWGSTPVLFHGFDDLNRLQLDAIETLGSVVGAPVTVSLPYEPGRVAFAARAGTFQALAPLVADHRSLGARPPGERSGASRALAHLERSLFEADAGVVDCAGAVRLLEGADERAEMELVAEQVAALIAQGLDPEEIVVLARGLPAAAELIEEVFAAAGVPFALRRRRRFADSSIGRALIGLLRCVGRDGSEASQEAGAADLLAWLRAPGLLQRGELADALEVRTRRAGASGAARARELWEQRHWRLSRIDELGESQARGGRALIDSAQRELDWLFCAPRRGMASVLAADEDDEARALAAGRRELSALGELARVAAELAPASAAELARTLERVDFDSGDRLARGAVSILDARALAEAAGARRCSALFVSGMQEGGVPGYAPSQPLLAEEERRRLAQTSGLLLGEHVDALAAERYLLYTAVARPQELLVLSWHAADDSGEPMARSLFVEDVCDLFGDRPDARSRPAPPAGPPAPVQPELPFAAGAWPAPLPSAALREERLLSDLCEHLWSASSLQTWIGCPVKWFVEKMLRPGAFDADAEPLQRGGLAHAVLKDTLEGLARESGSARLTLGRLALARELLARALEENEARFPLSVAPERRPGLRRRLRADLERYLQHAAEAESPLEPTHLELGFGFEGDDETGPASSLPALELAPGVMMRGRIDRVDVGAGGEAVLYDYKSRLAKPPARWIEEGELQVALYMRAVEDLLGLTVVGGFYQPLGGVDLRARGVLDAESGVELECVRGDARDRAAVQELVSQAVAAACEAAGEAARGELEPRPDSCAFGGGCSYPAICRCER